MKKLYLFIFLWIPSESLGKIRPLRIGASLVFLSKTFFKHIKYLFWLILLPIIDIKPFLRNSKGTIRYVKKSGTGDGSSWANASNDLQLMINLSLHGDQVWVAEGTYLSPIKSFKMKNGVVIYGGFPNSGNPTIEDRNWGKHKTILSGGNQRQVICNRFNRGNPLLSSAVLDGFTITKGESGAFASGGGGIYNNFASPTINHVTSSDNRASNGGGILNDSYSSPILTHVTICGNKADGGSGIVNFYCSSPILTNVIISEDIR